MSILFRFYLLGISLAAILALRAFISKDRETWVRCRTLSIMLSVLVLVLASGQWIIALLCAILAVLAFDELGDLQPDNKKWFSVTGWTIAPFFLLLPLMPIKLMAPLVCTVSLLALLVAFLSIRVATSIQTSGLVALSTHVTCGLAAIPLIGLIDVGQFLALIFLLQFNDGFAYLVGRAWGRTPFAPEISPRKSIEGAIGGLVGTSLGMAAMRTPLLPIFSEYSWHHAVGLVIIVVGFGISGDLLYSLAKRRANLKDFASRLPGHGGILDRLDSLLAVLPVALVWNIWWS